MAKWSTSERTTQHMFKIPAEIDEPGFGRWVLDCVLTFRTGLLKAEP